MLFWNLTAEAPVVETPVVLPVSTIIVVILTVLISAALGYFLGSINTAILYSRLRYKQDIREFGSKNAGMTNMLRTYGKGAAVITLVGDLLKTLIAVWGAKLVALGLAQLCPIVPGEFFDIAAYTAALFSVTGHCFPSYYGFKGGKGVAALAAAVLATAPVAFAVLIAIFVLIVLGTKYVSLGSVVCCMLYPVILNRIYGPGISNIFAMVIAVLVIYRHRENIKRLWNGKENKISLSKKNKDGKE